ncbi:efflux RND transporter permease subunit [Reinekea marina]|uniref:Efflux RND transporter permease subunit n=1 Tax=Reinekea marina TaxID=1310421 RepID=A0ABV7WR73_9GAMM|nr:efflux RND transporter permease subunit [Reinekea marina]MDN3648068.1 efflux RND transporter permease subunit [Reinekea marina]
MRKIDDKGLLAYFSQHRVAANLIMIMVVIAGMVALKQLHTQLMPDLTIPGVQVTTSWPDTSSRTVESTLTTPLESGLLNLKGVEEAWSWSDAGFSRIYLRYKMNIDPNDAVEEVNRYITNFDLPEGAEKPSASIDEFNEDVFSILISTDGPVNELRPLVQQFKNDLLSRGIAHVNVAGFPVEEIRVEANASNLIQQNTSINGLSQTIAVANANSPAGSLSSSATNISVTTDNEINSVNALSSISGAGSTPIYTFSDVQRVNTEGTRRYILENRASVRLLISRSEEIDSLETSDIIQNWLGEVRPNLPEGVDITVWWDLSEVVQGNLDMLISNGLVGLLLVIVILFFFLNRQVAWWSALGIPISIAGTFMLLFGTGGTINFLSVFAFLMALGIIVDDAIVVGEETVTQMEKGKTANEAALIAAKRMFSPIIASSLTTIAAFFPLLLLPGPFGEMLRPVPVVIISVIVASLIECFLILPAHLNHSLSKRKKVRSAFRVKMDNGFETFREKYYRPFVTAAIHNRAISVAVAFALCVIAYAMPITGAVPFSPELDVEDNMVTAYIEFHDDVSQQTVDQYTQALHSAIETADQKFAVEGESIVLQVYEISSAGEGFTQLQAKLVDRDNRPVSNADFLKEWGEHIDIGPEVSYVSIKQDSSSASGGSRVSFFLAGRSLDDLVDATEQLKRRLETYNYLSDITDDLPNGDDEIIFQLNSAGKSAGLTEASVATQLRQALVGSQADKLTQHDASINIIVSLPKSLYQSSAGLEDIPIVTPNNDYVRFGDIADSTIRKGLGTMFHVNGQLGVRVSAALLDEEANASEISNQLLADEVQPIIDQYGLQAEIQGSARDIEEMIGNLTLAAFASLGLVYFILVWVFSSYTWPIAVMSAIPFGLTGAIFGHWLLGMNLTFLSFFGLFGLSGIIINDSIILINRFQELREEGMDMKPAIIEASCQRLRAVMLTSITTVGGLIPLLLSSSIQAQLVQSMAASLAFGIAYGTVLVLLVIPCLLTYIESMNHQQQRFLNWIKSRFSRKQAAS